MTKEYLPMYARIKMDIINRVAAGELRVGDKLPTEQELCDEYGVSRITVSGALKALVDAGIIRKIKGSGSYIQRDNFSNEFQDVFSLLSDQVETTITYGAYNAPFEYLLLLQVFAGIFQLENPSVKVEIVKVESDATRDTDAYMPLIASGKAPTVGEFFFHADYAAIDALEPLDKLPGFEALAASIRSNSMLKTEDSHGNFHIHALPKKLNTTFLHINGDLARAAGLDPSKPPKSWDDLLAWAKALGTYANKKTGALYGIHIGNIQGWKGVMVLMPYLWGNSPPDMPPDLASFMKVVANPNFEHGLSFLTQLHKVGTPCHESCGHELFALGKIGMLISGSTWPVFLRRSMPGDFDYQVYRLPSAIKDTPLVSNIGRFELGIFRSAIHQPKELDAAWKWIRFLFRAKQQTVLTADSFPALKSTQGMLAETEPEVATVIDNAINNGVMQFDFKGQRQAFGVVGEAINACFAGKSSVEKAVNAAKNKLDTLFD